MDDNHLVQFNVFGFIVLRGVFSNHELEIINAEFEVGLAGSSDDDRAGIRGQLNWSNHGPETPFLRSLNEDPRCLGVAQKILGEDVIGSYCNSASFSGDRTEWHPDVRSSHWRGIKLGFYLQSQDENTGALRFIPGSHKEALFSDFKNINLKESFKTDMESTSDRVGLAVNEVPAYAAVSEPGDVIIFDNRIWHGSWGGGVDRRMCTMGYFARPKTREEEDLVREQMESEKRTRQQFPRTNEHTEYWLSNTEGSPLRQRWVDFLRPYFSG